MNIVLGRRRKKLRLNGPPPWDHIASALMSVLTMVLVQLSPASMQGFSIFMGFLLAIPLSGYLLVLSLFPAQSDLGSRIRAILSLGVSAFFVALVTLVIIPSGSQLTYVATILLLLALFLDVVGYVRWSAVPSKGRFILLSMRGYRSSRTPVSLFPVDAGEHVHSLLSDLGSLRRVLLSLGVRTFSAALAFAHWMALLIRKKLVVRSIKSRRSGRFLAGSPLADTRGQFVSLLFVLIIICAISASVFTNYANQSSSSEKVKKGDSASPYREDHLWINSLDIKSR